MDARVKQRRRHGFTRISPKHQVTIPAEALAKAGLSVGDPLKVEARANGEILLVREGNAVEQFAGILTGQFPPGYLDELRDEWE